MRNQIIRRSRFYLSLAGFAGLCALVVLPVSARVAVPVVVEPARFERVFPPYPSKLTHIHVRAGQKVKRGDELFRFQSPEIEHRRELAEIKKKLVEARIARSTADLKDKAELLTLQQERQSLISELDGYRRQSRQLVVRAPISGRLADMNTTLHVGRWHKQTDHLVTVIRDGKHVARGYVRERDLWRLSSGNQGKFIPDDFLLTASSVRISEISLANTNKIELLPLASIYGGPVASRQSDKNTITPVGATYQVTLDVDATGLDTGKVIRGVANIKGKPESLAASIWRQALRVLVRESGA